MGPRTLGRRLLRTGVGLLTATFFLILANIWTGNDHFGETAMLTLTTGLILAFVGGVAYEED